MKTHELKILPEYFEAVADGSKTFELRNNDRDFKAGDVLILKEHDTQIINVGQNGEELSRKGGYTGREIKKKITYVLKDIPGLYKNYAILALGEVEQ